MRIYKLALVCLLAFLAGQVAAHIPGGPERAKKRISQTRRATPRGECANSESQIDQKINNVRARLLGGGDCWWDLNEGKYVVPNVDPASGQRPVSSIYAGSVWLGGIDPAGNLKLACQDYRSDGKNDFWPGPLNEEGLTDESICKNWDRHFRVTGEEIRLHLKNLREGNTSPEAIPRGLRGWPAIGNPYFTDEYGFDLPFTSQGLAGFHDADEDNLYNPLKGDYPSIEIRGCPTDRYPDEMIFWIYNDHGGGAPHARTGGDAIQMEVQVQAFAYQTQDELNDMTFQRYKLINRATERIDSTFFAMWIDPDLGCHEDDYIGCDKDKNLMYIYNQDPVDGTNGCACGDVNTYCNTVPILGVDYFRGPLDTFGQQIGMSSFTYYNNSGVGTHLPGTTDPGQDIEYYRYITGSWRDGTPLTEGGTGYNPGNPDAIKTRYALSDPPNDQDGWSMCTGNLSFGDRRTLQASGPFSLKPGAVNELIIGVPWVPDIEYPCPDVEQLFRADKLAQGLFDNCFERLEGPDAPDVSWIELNNQVVAVLSNDATSNNFLEAYEQGDFLAPDSLFIPGSPPEPKEAAKYKFQGYKVYQVKNPNVSVKDFDNNPDLSRLIYQVDLRDSISKVYNWTEVEGPNGETYFSPNVLVDGQNVGVRHTFPITTDQFAIGNDKRLINHKKYYFAVIAYAHNEYAPFNPNVKPVTGQQTPYLPSSRNIQIATVIPRPVVDQELNAAYGQGVTITRLEGQGAGHNFLDLTDESREAAYQGSTAGNFNGELTYKEGRGPINVAIFNPFEVKDGEYEISLVDGNVTDAKLDDTARWELKNVASGVVIASDKTIQGLNEQIIKEYGFSVSIAQSADAGDPDDYTSKKLPGAENNGGIGNEYEYADVNNPWLVGLQDFDEGPQDFLKTENLDRDQAFDLHQGLSRLGNGWFYPYVLCDWRIGAPADNDWLLTPAWTEKQGILNASVIESANANKRRARLAALPNVDIVFTSDKSKWSRCIVVETASYPYTSSAPTEWPKDPALLTESPTTKARLMFDTRFSPSVGKYDQNGDGLPDPDGEKDANGNPLVGMGWFPGYAIDVETGRRLNVFFGENSCYSREVDPSFTGRDMLFNPTSNPFYGDFIQTYYNVLAGGHHYIYVTDQTYDGCVDLYKKLTPEGQANAATAKLTQMKSITWTSMLMARPGTEMTALGSGEKGLIPNDLVVKLRVDNPYQPWNIDPVATSKAHPKYRFKIENREAQALDQVQVESALDSVKVVPNPYYGYSSYEVTQFTNTVKITNLPGKCTVSIFSIDGKFVRKYERDEVYSAYNQITPAVEWDLKNSKGIPVSSGVYLININAPGMGERTIKWFGIQRQFDPSGL